MLNSNVFNIILSVMQKRRDFRPIFLYEYKLGHNSAETARNINGAFGDGAVSECTIRFWYKKFRSGNESLENDDRGRLPTTVDHTLFKQLFKEKTRKTVRKLATDFKVSIGLILEH